LAITIKNLKRARAMKLELERLKKRLEELRVIVPGDRAMKLTGVPSGTGQGNPVEEYVVKLEEHETRIFRAACELEEQLREIEEWISRLPPEEAKVISLRYIDGYSWREVERRAGYAQNNSTAYRIQRRALKRI